MTLNVYSLGRPEDHGTSGEPATPQDPGNGIYDGVSELIPSMINLAIDDNSQLSGYQGVHISTNGDNFSLPVVYNDRLEVTIGGLHGYTDGYFKVFVPAALASSWNSASETDFKAMIDGSASGVQNFLAEALRAVMRFLLTWALPIIPFQ